MDPALRMLIQTILKNQDEHGQKIDQLLAHRAKTAGFTVAASLFLGIIVQITIAIVGGN